MRGSLRRVRVHAVLPIAALIALLAGCGGGSDEVSSASLKPRLLPASALPGYGLERTFDWSDPVNLVGEGFFLPQTTHPTTAVKYLNDNGFEGAAGEVLTRGHGLDRSEVTVGVIKLKSADDANKLRDWMHGQDMQQPCFAECIFSPQTVPVPGAAPIKFVMQTAPAPKPPSGVKIPPGVKLPAQAQEGQANYKFEFTKGPYVYFASLQATPTAKAQVQAGAKAYFAQAKG
jgi:hypothetical protein